MVLLVCFPIVYDTGCGLVEVYFVFTIASYVSKSVVYFETSGAYDHDFCAITLEAPVVFTAGFSHEYRVILWGI